jgi:hypothetical protein
MALNHSAQCSQHERWRHQCAIQAIAKDLQLPTEEVAACYEAILITLGTKAKVREYLPVLIAKKIHRQYKNLKKHSGSI